MCGLVGIASTNMLARHKSCMTTLLFLDSLRGEDSTGVAAIRQDRSTAVLKYTVPGYDFIQNPKFETHLRLNDNVWIGHNRFGTVGGKTKANAHPFMVLNEEGECRLVGAHNGTLKNRYSLTDANNFGTDSEALLNEIDSIGVKEAINKVEGAWALTWYDQLQDKLFFLRNKERPLYYAYTDDHKTLVWASEKWMIQVACAKHDIKIDKEEVFTVEEDTLYGFEIPKPVVEKVKLVVKEGGLVGRQTNYFFQRETREEAKEATDGQTEKSLTVNTTLKSSVQSQTLGETQQQKKSSSLKSSSNVVEFTTGFIKGFRGKLITKKKTEQILAKGCSWCELEEINIKDRYAWLSEEDAVCHKCLDGTHDAYNSIN